MMKDNIVVFKKKHEAVQKHKELWGSLKGQVYQRLMPAGLPQSLADEFLKEFEPTFEELIYPGFNVSINLPEDGPYQDDFMDVIKMINENMDDYAVKLIGMVAYKDLMIFLQKKKLDGEL